MISNSQTFPSRLTLSGLVVVPWSRATPGRANLQRRWNCPGDGALKTSLICFEYDIYIYIMYMQYLGISRYIFRYRHACGYIFLNICIHIYDYDNMRWVRWYVWVGVYPLVTFRFWFSEDGLKEMLFLHRYSGICFFRTTWPRLPASLHRFAVWCNTSHPAVW